MPLVRLNYPYIEFPFATEGKLTGFGVSVLFNQATPITTEEIEEEGKKKFVIRVSTAIRHTTDTKESHDEMLDAVKACVRAAYDRQLVGPAAEPLEPVKCNF
jgi:hypothetical protein